MQGSTVFVPGHSPTVVSWRAVSVRSISKTQRQWGIGVGADVGVAVGLCVGVFVGMLVGAAVVGAPVGARVGDAVGAAVGGGGEAASETASRTRGPATTNTPANTATEAIQTTRWRPLHCLGACPASALVRGCSTSTGCITAAIGEIKAKLRV